MDGSLFDIVSLVDGREGELFVALSIDELETLIQDRLIPGHLLGRSFVEVAFRHYLSVDRRIEVFVRPTKEKSHD